MALLETGVEVRIPRKSSLVPFLTSLRFPPDLDLGEVSGVAVNSKENRIIEFDPEGRVVMVSGRKKKLRQRHRPTKIK